MDSNTIDGEELFKDPDRLFEHLGDRIDDMSRTLDDDENFCNQDVDATLQYVQNIEKKFSDKIEELKIKLEEIRRENQTTSEQNKKQFQEEIQEISGLFGIGKHPEAWKKLQNYEKTFQQRSTVIQRIPKLHMNEMDIEQYFSSNFKPTKPSPIQSTIIITPTTVDDDKQDAIDDTLMTKKERIRQAKPIETVHIDRDNEELNNEKTEPIVDNSQFGIRSKQQQTATNETITNPPATTESARRVYQFSTRLGQNLNNNNNNLQFSGRNISAGQTTNPNPRPNHEQARTIPNSMSSISQRYNHNLTLNPVSHYQHERNIILLMTCNAHFIVLFKSQRNRLDRWHLGAIERRTHNEHSLDWHDGLIISMGYIGNDQIYMFTEREIFLYSITQHRKLDSRILPRGNDDGIEISHFPNEYQRGIGTVFRKYAYHIYSNRNSHWTLSKNNLLENFSHVHDYDLTRMFPDVSRFIHLSVNEKTIQFLVQMEDSSYAVVFCSTNDCIINDSMVPVTLIGAKQPLTIYSAYISSIKREVFFINDPSIDILHLITLEKYLHSYPVLAHAICYVADKDELMIVTNNSICSVNFNELNSFFSSDL